MERLAIPKRATVTESQLSAACREGIPPNPLPTWLALPLDAKLPMLPGPKGAVILYTTNVGEKIHKSSPELDFDLTDPSSKLMSNNYKPLHDPHLKMHLNAEQMKKRLQNGDFITADGKVLCTLKEFNEYRQYLRKINLALDRKRERELASQGDTGQRRMKGVSSSEINKMREEKVKEMRERLQKKHEEEKQNLLRIMQEEEERARRIREEQKTKSTDKERKQNELQEKRRQAYRKRHFEERRRKIAMMRRWLEEDRIRTARADARRQEHLQERQQKLEERWEERKRQQAARLDAEQEQIRKIEEAKARRIRERERAAQRQRQRMQAIFVRMNEARRKERESLEEEYARKFACKMEHRRTKSAQKLKSKGRRSKGKSPLKSTWDLEKTLLMSFSDHEDDADKQRRTMAFFEEEDTKVRRTVERDVSLTDLGLGDFRGASFAPKKEKEKLSKKMSELGLGEFHGAKFKVSFADDTSKQQGHLKDQIEKATSLTQLLRVYKRQKRIRERRPTFCTGQGHGDMHGAISIREEVDEATMEEEICRSARNMNIEEVAKCIVDMNVFLTTKVIYPAYQRYLKEEELFNRPDSPLPTEDYTEYLQSPDLESSFFSSTSMSSAEEEEPVSQLPSKSPRSQKTGFAGGVRFSVVAESIPRGHLDKMAGMAEEDLEEYSVEGTDADDEDDESDTENTFASKLQGKDSITLLRQASSGGMGTAELMSILQALMNELSKGALSPDQMKTLFAFIQEMLASASTSQSQDSLVSGGQAATTGASASSLLAEEIVRSTLARVEQELLMEGFKVQQDSASQPLENVSSSTIDTLTQFLVNKALAMAADSLMGMSAETEGRSTPQLQQAHSDTSDFITRMLEKVVRDLEKEHVEEQTARAAKARPKSATSEIVRGTLSRVLKDIQASEKNKESDTTLFVMETINRMAREIHASGQATNLNWDSDVPLKPLDSQSSTTSILVRKTLSKVLHEIEAEHTTARTAGKSATSICAEAIVNDTLNHCLIDLRKNFVPTKKLVQLASSLLSSRKGLGSSFKGTPIPQQTRSLDELCFQESRGPLTTSSIVAESLIREVLIQTKKALTEGTLSDSDIQDMAAVIKSESSSVNKIRSQTSNTNHIASLIVEDALNKALNIFTENNLGAYIAEQYAALQKVVSQENQDSSFKTTKPAELKTTKSAELKTAKSAELKTAMSAELKTKKSTELKTTMSAEMTSTMSSESAIATAFVNKILNKVMSDVKRGSASQEELSKAMETLKTSLSNFSSKVSSSSNPSSKNSLANSDSLPGTPQSIRSVSNKASLTGSSQSKPSCNTSKRNSLTNNETNEENSMQTDSHFNHIVIQDSCHSLHDSDSDDESSIHLMMGEKELELPPEVTDNALSYISVKETSALDIPYRNAKRNSFKDLTHPDVSSCFFLHHGSEAHIKKKVFMASSMHIAHETTGVNSADAWIHGNKSSVISVEMPQYASAGAAVRDPGSDKPIFDNLSDSSTSVHSEEERDEDDTEIILEVSRLSDDQLVVTVPMFPDTVTPPSSAIEMEVSNGTKQAEDRRRKSPSASKTNVNQSESKTSGRTSRKSSAKAITRSTSGKLSRNQSGSPGIPPSNNESGFQLASTSSMNGNIGRRRSDPPGLPSSNINSTSQLLTLNSSNGNLSRKQSGSPSIPSSNKASGSQLFSSPYKATASQERLLKRRSLSPVKLMSSGSRSRCTSPTKAASKSRQCTSPTKSVSQSSKGSSPTKVMSKSSQHGSPTKAVSKSSHHKTSTKGQSSSSVKSRRSGETVMMNTKPSPPISQKPTAVNSVPNVASRRQQSVKRLPSQVGKTPSDSPKLCRSKDKSPYASKTNTAGGKRSSSKTTPKSSKTNNVASRNSLGSISKNSSGTQILQRVADELSSVKQKKSDEASGSVPATPVNSIASTLHQKKSISKTHAAARKSSEEINKELAALVHDGVIRSDSNLPSGSRDSLPKKSTSPKSSGSWQTWDRSDETKFTSECQSKDCVHPTAVKKTSTGLSKKSSTTLRKSSVNLSPHASSDSFKSTPHAAKASQHSTNSSHIDEKLVQDTNKAPQSDVVPPLDTENTEPAETSSSSDQAAVDIEQKPSSVRSDQSGKSNSIRLSPKESISMIMARKCTSSVSGSEVPAKGSHSMASCTHSDPDNDGGSSNPHITESGLVDILETRESLPDVNPRDSTVNLLHQGSLNRRVSTQMSLKIGQARGSSHRVLPARSVSDARAPSSTKRGSKTNL